MKPKTAEMLIAMLMVDEETRTAFLLDPTATAERFVDPTGSETGDGSILDLNELELVVHPDALKDGKGIWGPNACDPGKDGQVLCNCGGGSGGHLPAC